MSLYLASAAVTAAALIAAPLGLYCAWVLACRLAETLLDDPALDDEYPRFDGQRCAFCGSRSYHDARCSRLDRLHYGEAS